MYKAKNTEAGWQLQKPGEAWKNSPSEPRVGSNSANILISDFLPPELGYNKSVSF